MPFICFQLKTIYKPMTSFLLSSVLFFCCQTLHAFEWPFSNDSEVQKKLSSHELTASTRYFARGPTFLPGQKWNESEFTKTLTEQNYRLRQSDQSLLDGDAKKVAISECQAFTQLPHLTDLHSCWAWQTHAKQNFLIVINPEKVIESAWTGMPFQAFWKASLDPILVAQYRGQEPIMQNELKISGFPVNCMNAVMAIEDNEFLNHSGVSYSGLARAFVKNIVKMRAAQGGSTITQQLVKNYFLTPEKTIKRKVKELFLASKLESEWTKDEILETYLNIIYMGQTGAFQVRGFGAAANVYFNKSVQNLELPECALLAAIINNPAQNNPWKKAEKALSRRNLVLTKMKEFNLISQIEFDTAIKAPLPPVHTLKAVETAPYFFDAVRKQMNSLNIEVEGAAIHTSLDLEAQAKAQKALLAHIAELEKKRKNLQTNKDKGFRLEGLVASSENSTGLVNVFVGGQSYRQTQFNRALDGHRQIGSLIKPFVYLGALTYGFDGKQVDPLTTVVDEKFVWKYDRKSWSPSNYEKNYNGEIPIYFALKESLNSPTAQIAQKVGLNKIIALVQQIGFTSKMETTPSTSLGATEHYPTEILEAYRALANFGAYHPSSFIEKIEDREGEVKYTFAPLAQPKLDQANVAVLVGMMKETFRSGTAKSSAAYGWTAPSAGKTGTTSDNKDAWFAGFTPHQTSIAWIGYDQSLSSKLTGASGPVPVWIELMKSYQNVWPDDDFKWPDSVETREVPLHGTDKKTELVFRK
jgi:penicillin-binding protein 1B